MAEHITAIIPTYNRHESLLTVALPSILKQTRPVDEILIVVDGEDPASFIDLQSRVHRSSPPWITMINIQRPEYPEDRGDFWLVQGWKARNAGLDMALPGWVAPLDDDDEWSPDHIELLVGQLEKDGTDFVYGRAKADKFYYGRWPPSGANFTDGSQVYRHDMGYRYDPECIYRGKAADQDLWDRMVKGGVRFSFIRKIVHYYHPAKR